MVLVPFNFSFASLTVGTSSRKIKTNGVAWGVSRDQV